MCIRDSAEDERNAPDASSATTALATTCLDHRLLHVPLPCTQGAPLPLGSQRSARGLLPAHGNVEEVLGAQREAHMNVGIGLAVDERLHTLGRDVHVDVERWRLARDHLEPEVALAEQETRCREEQQRVLAGGLDLELDVAKRRLAHLAGEAPDRPALGTPLPRACSISSSRGT